MVGIVSYGAYIPKYRIRLSEIAGVWGKNDESVTSSLRLSEKSVPGYDEDAVTIAVEAAQACLGDAQLSASRIEAIFVGSESHPYAVNPTSTIVGELLGVGPEYMAADLEFACKAGSAGIQAVAGFVASKRISLGLAIGADTAQSRPHDALEYTAASGGGAFLLGRELVAAELVAYTSYTTDTPDFWRRDGIRYPTHAGRFTGEPAYFAHVFGASRKLLETTGMKPSDMAWCVFHMPNGKFPRFAAKTLGFNPDQIAPSLIIDHIGNPYSASSLLGLAAILDIAKPDQYIFMASYGSGAGSDAFIWRVRKPITILQKRKVRSRTTVRDRIDSKMYVSYVQYLKQTRKI